MIANPNRRQRGSLTYGLAAILVMTGVLVGIVLDRSLDSYRRSVQLEARLRGLAAIEGAGRVMTPGEGATPPPIAVGVTEVRFSAPDREGDLLRVPAVASIRTRTDRVFHEHHATLEFTRSAAQTWAFVGVQP